MSSSIELEFSEQNENQFDTLTIICFVDSINGDDRRNIETKLNCLTERICFVQTRNNLKDSILYTKGFALLLIDCNDYPGVAVERNDHHEAMPIYSRCSHLPSTCPWAASVHPNKVNRSDRRI